MIDALRLTLRAELRRRWRPMLAMMLLTALLGGVVLTAPPDSPGPHLPARPGPIRAPALGQAIVSPRRRQPQRDGAITGPSVPLGQSELIIGTERIGASIWPPRG